MYVNFELNSGTRSLNVMHSVVDTSYVAIFEIEFEGIVGFVMYAERRPFLDIST